MITTAESSMYIKYHVYMSLCYLVAVTFFVLGVTAFRLVCFGSTSTDAVLLVVFILVVCCNLFVNRCALSQSSFYHLLGLVCRFFEILLD